MYQMYVIHNMMYLSSLILTSLTNMFQTRNTYVLGVGQVGFWSSQAKSSISENQTFKFKYLSSQILAKSSQIKY